MEALDETPAFAALAEHQRAVARLPVRQLFEQDPGRFDALAVELGDLLFDPSKHRITRETVDLLVRLAEERRVPEAIEAMFSGAKINATER
jgi:glucose-6-phosphate isomerase